MEKIELFQKYCEIEKKIVPIKDFLEEKKDSTEYKGIYRGIITLQSPLVFNPEILFIGINSGDGAYREKNWNNLIKNETPLRMVGEDEMCFKELNWFQRGNARVKPFEWYQRNQKPHNPFPKNMINLLYEIAAIKYNEPNDYNKPLWYEDFGKRIMCTNLYPIVTTNASDLTKIHRNLAHEIRLQNYWKSESKCNEWDVRKFFIKRIYELVELTQPKLIVCMGLGAFNDFLFTNCKEEIPTTEITIRDKKIPIVGFSRTRKVNWGSSQNIKKIASEICNQLQ
jgi:hypothetical protein